MKLKHTVMAAALSGWAISSAVAQAKAVEPDYTLSLNAGVVSEYRYRGLTQTRFRPTAQGGVDFAHKNGFYLGAWGSGIQWITDAAGDSRAEMDVYGGYKGRIGEDLGFDVGVLAYVYPGHDLTVSPNTTEVYGALTYGSVAAKYSHSVTNLFGFANSKGSGYLDLSASFDLGGGWSVVPHVGYQRVANHSSFSYADYALALNKDFGNGLVGSANWVGADVKKVAGVPVYVTPQTKNMGRTGLVLGLKYNF